MNTTALSGTDADAMIAAATALAAILHDANDAGLPAPYHAMVCEYAPHRHEAGSERAGGIDLLVSDLDKLTAWALWVEQPVNDTDTPHKDKVHARLDFTRFGVGIRVTALVPVTTATTRTEVAA